MRQFEIRHLGAADEKAVFETRSLFDKAPDPKATAP
jgi:hypothetical protein